jgi:hypothetical protein
MTDNSTWKKRWGLKLKLRRSEPHSAEEMKASESKVLIIALAYLLLVHNGVVPAVLAPAVRISNRNVFVRS